MVIKVDLSSNASVKLVCVDEENTAAAYLANLYIPIFSLDSGKLLRKYEVSNQIVGLSFNPNKKKILYAIDDSFGLHVFDVRSDSKKKFRLNPDVENHNVVCTALSAENVLAVSSSEFGGGILDVRGSRRREHHPHVISLFDVRNPGEPITTYNRRHKAEITSMEFYRNGHDLLTGDRDGAVKSFNCQLRDEDNALRWERWAKGPITKVGVINKRIVYSISDRSEATVIVDSKGNVETLYGVVNDNADAPIAKTSMAFYKKPEFVVGLIKGVNDGIPLVAVHGVESKEFIALTAMDQKGVRQDKPMLTYPGHVGEVKCMTATPELLLTGGEDGKVLIQWSNFKNPKFGEDSIDHHRLTLNRQNLAVEHDAKADSSDEDDDDKEDEDSSESSSDSSESSSDSDESDGPSTSTAKSSKSKSKSKKDKEKSKKRAEEEKAKKKADEEKAKKKADEEKAKKKADEEKKAKEERAKRKAEEEKAKRKAEEAKAAKKKAEEEKERAREKARKEAKAASSSSSSSSSKKRDSSPSTSSKKRDSSPPTSPKPSTSASSLSSSSRKETKEERQARKEKEARKAKKEEARKAAEREERRKMKEAETKEERALRKEKERRERAELERKEKERAERKKKHDGQGSSSDAKKAKKD